MPISPIFEHQPLIAGVGVVVVSRNKLPTSSLRIGGQKERKASSALPWIYAASRQNRATRTVYNPPCHPESQPDSILTLGGKEWLKDARKVGCGDANSVVGNGDPYALNRRNVPVRCFASADIDGAACVDGFHRIQEQS